MTRTTAILAPLCFSLPLRASAQDERGPSLTPVYRVVGGDSLQAHVFLPPARESGTGI